MPDVDVLVVGAGPAGAVAALHVKQAAPGLDVVLLERDRAVGSPVRCAENKSDACILERPTQLTHRARIRWPPLALNIADGSSANSRLLGQPLLRPVQQRAGCTNLRRNEDLFIHMNTLPLVIHLLLYRR